jgi:hypothetical protein
MEKRKTFHCLGVGNFYSCQKIFIHNTSLSWNPRGSEKTKDIKSTAVLQIERDTVEN